MSKQNTISHIEIPAPDLAEAVAFYSKVFNWKIEIITEKSYAFFKIGDTNTGGAFDSSLSVAAEKSGIQIVVDVEDIEHAIHDIETAGGFVTKTKTEIGGGHGFYACFRDPAGNHLQIHSRT